MTPINLVVERLKAGGFDPRSKAPPGGARDVQPIGREPQSLDQGRDKRDRGRPLSSCR